LRGGVFGCERERILLSCLNKVVDGKLEVSHNLVSLLLTNKTIRGDAEGKGGAGKVL